MEQLPTSHSLQSNMKILSHFVVQQKIDQDLENETADVSPGPLPPTAEGDCGNEIVTVVTIASPIRKVNGMGKKKRKANDIVDIAILEELKKTSHSSQPKKDANEDRLFMQSLIPQLKCLVCKVKSQVSCQIQQLLYEAEFEDCL